MRFLAPLGFLAAISIIILIIIYIIRPNYQQKYISSTFIWKLSLKYKKKRVPTSKLRDILIIICQIAILASCSVILAQPARLLKMLIERNEVILILDSSASMRVATDGETRYERALRRLEEKANEVIASGGVVSVIKADDVPSIVVDRVGEDDRDALNNAISLLSGDMDSAKKPLEQLGGCGYGGADMTKAMELCERLLNDNPTAATYLYTDSDYYFVPENIQLIDCRAYRQNEEGDKIAEWNAAILDVKAEFVDNYYRFSVTVASYGASSSLGIRLDVKDVNLTDVGDDGNQEDSSMIITTVKECNDGEETVVTFRYEKTGGGGLASSEEDVPMSKGIVSYSSVTARLGSPDSIEDDSVVPLGDDFEDDNRYVLPGGIKPSLRIHYAANVRTPFFEGVLDVLQNGLYADKWKIEVDRYKPGSRDSNIEVDGFDFYIYDGIAADDINRLPTDGVCLLIGCDELPNGVSVDYRNGIISAKDSLPLTGSASDHPLLKNIEPELITISKAKVITLSDNSGYTALMECNGNPVLAACNKPEEKVVLMSFSLAYSNLAVLPDFSLLLKNIIDYYIPATIEKNVYEVGEAVGLNCRGESVSVAPATGGADKTAVFESFPTEACIYQVGRYNVSTDFSEDSGKESIVQEIYVKMSGSESNINKTGDSLDDPYHGAGLEDVYRDLAFYVALALVFFVFAEWLLHLREGL